MTDQFDYYAVLGVEPDATKEELQEAFADLRMSFPAEMRDPETNPEYRRIAGAYEVLIDPQRRATYDSLLVETSPLTFKVQIEPSREQINLSDTAQLLYLLVTLSPPANPSRQRRPLNLCLVVDRSTSMRGNRLHCVKSAVDLIVEKLAPDDVLSLVSFSDRAEVVLPAGPATDKAAISRRVRGITASGGTEIYHGLNTGIKQIQQVPLSQYTNHLILLTDGHTYGDADNCLALAGKVAAEGIGFSAFGIGSEWNDQFLDQLVSPSGGQSGFIEDPEQIIDFLQKRIKGLGAVYAQNLRLLNEFPKSITVKQAVKLRPFAQPLSLSETEIKLGDMENRASLSFLLEISVAPQPIETRITIPLTLMAILPRQKIERTFKHQQQIYVLSEAPLVEPPESVINAVQILNINYMSEKASEEAEAGQLETATKRMRHLTTRLLEAGETQLAQQAHNEAERLASIGALSLEGRKRLKYGTRALLNRTSQIGRNDQV